MVGTLLLVPAVAVIALALILDNAPRGRESRPATGSSSDTVAGAAGS